MPEATLEGAGTDTSVLKRKIDGLAPKRREALQKLMKQSGIGHASRPAEEPPVRRISRSAPHFPLSSAQERLWFLEQLSDTRGAFNVHATFRLKQHFDPALLGKAVQALAQRHEPLRTAFRKVGGEPRQLPVEARPFYEVHDLRTSSAEDRAALIQSHIDAHRRQPFDLAAGRPFAVALLTVSDTEQWLLFTLHHIASDGSSHGLLLDELVRLYFSFVADDTDGGLPVPGLQYIDYASWQRERFSRLEGQLAQWKSELAGSEFFLELPGDFTRPDQFDFAGGAVPFEVPGDKVAALQATARRLNCTMFMCCLAAFAVVLAKRSGRRDFIVGTDVANRNRLEVKGLVGFFINQLPLRCRWEGDPSLGELIQQLRQICLRAYDNQDVPFNFLVDQLQVPRSRAHTPMFQTKFALDNAAVDAQANDLLELVEQPADSAEFDLEVAMKEVAGTLRGHFRYRTSLFAVRTIEGMREDYLAVLDLIAGRPDTRLSRIEPASARGRELHGPVQPVALPLIDSLLRAPDPDATAVNFAGRRWTCAELRHAVETLAAYLLDAQIGPGSVIAIGLARGFDVLVAHLAAMRVGACYVPIDLNQGAERIGFVLENCGARHIITTTAMRERLPDAGLNAILLDGEWLATLARPIPATWPRACGSQFAYILYTSGSSGKPKGVAVGLHSLANFLVAMLPVTGLTSADKLLAVTTTAFDISGLELYLPLLAKATLVIATSAEVQDSRLLWDRLSLDGITVMQATPATWRGLCAIARGRRLPDLRAFCGGEAFPADLVAELGKLCKSVHNMYGPTETTIWSSSARLEGALQPGLAAAPLGTPILNTSFYVLDSDGNRRPAGAPGELCIAGEGLAIGYLGRPALTATSFIPDAWSGRAGGRLYLTGDVASLSHQGSLHYLGRRDHQIKIRGYRIELGEIESVLCAHGAIESAVAVAVAGADGDALLHAFVRGKGPCDDERAASAGLLEFASRHLPAYMMPATVTWLEVLPLTANGKIDRGHLQRQAAERRTDPQSAGTPPSSEMEYRVADLWRELLAVDRVFLEQDFFRYGGHSLLAVKLLDRIETVMGRRVPLRRFFDAPTLAGLVKAIQDSPRTEQALPRLVPDPHARHEPFPLSDLQEAYLLGRQSDLLPGGIATQNYMEFEVQDLDVERFTDCWNVLVERHDMLRAVFDRSGRQRVLPAGARHVPEYMDVSTLPAEEQARFLQSTRETMSRTALPESSGPLFALRISRLDARRYRLHFCIDMLISDAMSNGILFSELHSLYEKREATLPALDVTFRDYMIAERQLRDSGDYQRARDYWVDRLDRFPAAPELPLAAASAAVPGQRFVRRKLTLDETIWSAVRSRAGHHGVSPTVTLLAAFSQVLAAWSSNRHFALNLTMFNRRNLHEQVERIVGDFTSSLLLEVAVDGGHGFVDRARQLQDRLWRDMDHAAFSGVSVMRELNRRRGGMTPVAMPVVFTSMLGVESPALRAAAQAGERDVGPAGGESFSISQTSQVWLDHQVAEIAGSLQIVWDAIDELFPVGVLDAMFAAYSRVLHSLALEPGWNTRLNLVPVEQLAVREQVNSRRAEIDPALLHELFERSADRFSASEALVAGAKRITYGELEAWTNGLAAQLRAANDTQGPVAVVMDKSWEQVVSVLAILKSGAPYLPIDASLPATRIDALIRDGGCRVVLVRSGGMHESREHRIIEVSDDALSTMTAPRVPVARTCTDIAYIIYTSGSTGNPKGVVIDHRGAVNTVLDINRRFGIVAGDRVLAVSSLSFDLSVYDIFGVLAAGGTIVIPCGAEVADAGSWRRLIERERITVWNSVPALMQLVVEQCEALGSGSLVSLKVAMLSGDWVPVDLPERITKLARECRVISLGGATEASIWSIFHPVTGPTSHLPSVPYGTPLTNHSFHVLDDRLEPCPDWVPGHLYIGGTGVAKGYWRREELTAASFIQTPDHGVLYRTGDLGRYTEDGVIEFLGRQDSQVKIQGYRVELGEIEAALQAHPAVKSAVVTAFGTRTEGKRLVAYIVPRDAGLPAGEHAELKTGAERSLFQLEQHSVRKLPAELSRTPMAAPRTLASSGRAASEARPLTLEALAQCLGALRQVRLDDAPLPKYFYPSASSLYPVQIYVNVEGVDVPGLPAGFFYYSSAENALIRLAEAQPGLTGVQLVWVADLDAITPMYPRSEALRFIQLEVGYLQALLDGQARYLGMSLCCHWTDELLIDRTRLPRTAQVLGCSTLTCAVEPHAESDGTVEFDVLKRQSFREFSERPVSAQALGQAMNRVAKGLPDDIEIILYAYPGRCTGLDGWFRWDRALAAPIRLGVEDDPVRAGELHGEDNRELFAKSAMAVLLVGAAKPEQFIAAGYAGQQLQSFSWSVGLGFCPIGRVEESRLATLLSREQCIVLQGFIGGAIDESQLTRWVVAAAKPKAATPADLERYLLSKLPAYMVPKIYLPLDSVPLSANGKVDRKALPDPQLAAPERMPAVPPRTTTESQLLALWKDELATDGIGVQDNFFTAGGNSLTAMRIISRLEIEHGLSLPLRGFFETPTVEQLAAVAVAAVRERPTDGADLHAYARGGRSKPVSLPLTTGQSHIFAHCQLREDSSYNITSAFRIDGELPEPVLRAAVERIVARHDALRMRFAYAGGEVVQIADATPRLSFESRSLETLDAAAADREVARLIDLEAGAHLDLFEGPLVTCKSLRLSASRQVVVINVHHIVADHLAMDVFRTELLQSCFSADARQRGLPPPPLQFSDFVLWQREFLRGPEARRQLEYWQATLRNLPRQKLPDEKPAEEAGSAGRWEEWRVPAPVLDALRARCATLDVSMFSLLLGAIQQLLSVQTGQQDIAIATPVSARFHPDLQNVVGLMLNTLIMRVDQAPSTRKSAFIEHVRGVVVSALEHKDVPVEIIQKALGATADQRLFGVRYVYRRIRAKKDASESMEGVTSIEVPRKDAKFDMLVSFNEYDDALVGDFEYRAGLWSEASVTRLKRELLAIIGWLSAPEDETLSDLHARMASNPAPAADGTPAERAIPTMRAADRRQEIAQFVRADADRIRAAMHEQGGVLFRGFRISGAAHLERLIREGFEGTPLSYENRSTPRSAVAGKIYTSTEYPASQTIPLHNENSYTRSWPAKIFFYCVKPSEVGGETPVADSRRVLARLPSDVVERFDRHGVMYVRNYQDLDIPWTEVFQTQRREDVERYCRDHDIEYEWLGQDHLRTRQRCQAIVRHPVTGEAVWFNQAHLFHVSNLPADVREALQASMAECDLPRNAFLGDGSSIHADDLAAIRDAYEQEKQVFPWQAGDILCLDNLLMAHGRNPYEGSRKVLVGMS